MATTVPAMQAHLGNTTYYILSMKAQEVADKVKIPRELNDWSDMSVEEIYQRDINYTRVKTQIAPYLANDDSRFFGAIIVAAINFAKEVSFEPLEKLVKKGDLPNAYRRATDGIGFLTFSGGEILIPLDGQHRLKAIQFATTGSDEKGKKIPAINQPCTKLADEDVTVILMDYDPKHARRIFTKVNRYAKPTTTGQNIVTDDDDVVAVIARDVTNNQIGGRLVKYTSNTLNRSDEQFTTLSIVYNCTEQIITSNFPTGRIDKTHLPSPERIKLYRNKATEVWEKVLDNIEVFSDALSDKEPAGDERRRQIRAANLLGRPVAQECLIRAFLRLTNPNTKLSEEAACARLNNLPWPIANENLAVWDRVLWAGGADGKIITKNRTLATNLIAYLAGEVLTEEQQKDLLEDYRGQFPEPEREGISLPPRPAA